MTPDEVLAALGRTVTVKDQRVDIARVEVTFDLASPDAPTAAPKLSRVRGTLTAVREAGVIDRDLKLPAVWFVTFGVATPGGLNGYPTLVRLTEPIACATPDEVTIAAGRVVHNVAMRLLDAIGL